MTFVVRLSADSTGRLRGVVERVRTGEKRRFDGLEALGPLIGRMAASERATGPGAGLASLDTQLGGETE